MTALTSTVIVATVDRPLSLARCLDGLAVAELLPDEIIIVDQGGLDETGRVVGERGRLPIRHLSQPRSGLSAARNAGLAVATGEIVAITDDDCVPDPCWLSAIVQALGDDRGLAAVTGPMLPLDAADDRLVAVSSRTDTTRAEFSGRTLPWAVGTGGNMAFRREVLAGIGGYDERLGAGSRGRAGEDLDVVRRLLALGGRIRYEPAAVCRHERKTVAERRATRSRYGYGAGAGIGRWLGERDPYALVALLAWLALRGRRAATALRGRSWGEIGDELRVLRGTAAGLWYGVRLDPWSSTSTGDDLRT